MRLMLERPNFWFAFLEHNTQRRGIDPKQLSEEEPPTQVHAENTKVVCSTGAKRTLTTTSSMASFS